MIYYYWRNIKNSLINNILLVNQKKIDKLFVKSKLKELWNNGILNSFDKKVKEAYLKYNVLLLNYLYHRDNDLGFDWNVLDNWKKLKIKKPVSSIINWVKSDTRVKNIKNCLWVYWKKDICTSYISFPLFAMNEYLNENLDNLKDDNTKQIEFAKKFWIKNLQHIKNIVEILWFNNILNWQTVNLSTDIFSFLIREHKVHIKNTKFINDNNNYYWNQFLLSFTVEHKIYNYENLLWWLRALWVDKEMWLMPVKIPTIMIIQILEYVENIYWYPKWYWKNVVSIWIMENEIKNIYNIFKQDLPWKKNQVLSNIRWLLKAFWYIILN